MDDSSNTAWIETVSGSYLDLMDPDPDTIVIGDIAHALTYQCRYNGHVR